MSNYEKKCFEENRGKMWQPLKEWKLEDELEMIKGNFTLISSSKQTSKQRCVTHQCFGVRFVSDFLCQVVLM